METSRNKSPKNSKVRRMVDIMDVLAISIAAFVPVCFLAFLCHYTETKAREIFTSEEYEMYMNNEEIS
jgi:hypothetical protein